MTYQNMINTHRWLKHFPNQSRTSQIRKRMRDLSRVMEKHANPGKWRESHEGWVGNKGTHFPSPLALPYQHKRWKSIIK